MKKRGQPHRWLGKTEEGHRSGSGIGNTPKARRVGGDQRVKQTGTGPNPALVIKQTRLVLFASLHWAIFSVREREGRKLREPGIRRHGSGWGWWGEMTRGAIGTRTSGPPYGRQRRRRGGSRGNRRSGAGEDVREYGSLGGHSHPGLRVLCGLAARAHVPEGAGGPTGEGRVPGGGSLQDIRRPSPPPVPDGRQH